MTVTNNWVHDNRGPGLWLDNNNRGFVIEHNYIADNDGQALFMEAGYDARVRYNNFKRNAIVSGREFQEAGDPFPIGAVYVSENGSPQGYGLNTVPLLISDNNFEDNWGGVNLWENADRYCASGAHTHPPYCTIKIDLRDDSQCESAVDDVIPESVGDKYRCRWSTENVIVEENVFRIDKAEVGPGCAGENYCGISGVFANYGSYPEFGGYVIPWRITFQQGNVFRNNRYFGDWHFAGFQTTQPDGSRVSWEEWTAPAPEVPDVFTHDNRPETFGQDHGSTLNEAEPEPGDDDVPPVTPSPSAVGPVGEAAVASVSLNRRVSIRGLLSRGLRYRVSCESFCRATGKLRISAAGARRHGLRRKLGHSKRAVEISAGASRTIVVPIDRRLHRPLQKAVLRRLEATVVTIVRTGDGRQRLKNRVVLRG